MTYEQVLWAMSHDWYRDWYRDWEFNNCSNYRVITTTGELFTSYQSLREWAGY